MRVRIIISVLLLSLPVLAGAGGVSLLQDGTMDGPRVALYAPSGSAAQSGAGSLFAGRAEGGLFADRPAHQPAYPDARGETLKGRDIEVIRALIREAESRRDGYDAVQHGARIRPPGRPTQLTLQQIFDWIADTPGQPHAIGKYQFIPKTLARVVRKTGTPLSARFSPAIQDRLADVLLAEAGFERFRTGALSRVGFMNNLAKIWAGLPNSSGKSHYHGYAGNKASITWARFDAAMAAITPG